MLDIALLAVGIFQSIYVFKIGGLPGVILGSPANHKEGSVWKFGLAITEAVANPNYFGVRMIQAIYMFFAVVMPFASVLVVAVLFLVPMSLKTQKRVHALAEISNAWSSLEVFLIASIICTVQLPKFVHAIRTKNCGVIENAFKKLDFKDIFGTDKCFDVQSHMKLDAITLYVGVGMHIFLMYIFLKLSHRVVDERIERESHKNAAKETEKETTERESKSCFQRFNVCLAKAFFVDFIPPEESAAHQSLIDDPEETLS